MKAITVSNLVDKIKQNLEKDFRQVFVEGEISNFSLSSSGHYYFSLIDKDSLLSVALFKMDAFRNPLVRKIKDGDKVSILGDINVYSKRGSFQLIAKRIVPVGTGDTKEQFEKLKQKLFSLGLFDIERKKAIPLYPKKIALITALHGAAVRDFLSVYKRKGLWMDVVIIPALVQGDEAPRSLIKALEKAYAYQQFDVIVLTRGGGSSEDLNAFNDEALIMKISESSIPIVSAVGHEVDTTLCDYVSDLRTETPTAAAERLCLPQEQIALRLKGMKRSLLFSIRDNLSYHQKKLSIFSPYSYLQRLWEQLRNWQKRLERISPILANSSEMAGFYEKFQRLDECHMQLKFKLANLIEPKKRHLEHLMEKLALLDSKNILSRGFSYITDETGEVVKNYQEFKKRPTGKELVVNFYDGKGKVNVQ